MARNKHWIKKELEYLKNNYNKKDISELSKELDRTESSIESKAYRLGILRTKYKNRWSDTEDRYLRNNYNNKPIKAIARYLGRTESAVIHRASQLNISKSRVRKLWSEDDLNILRDNCHKGIQHCMVLLDRSKDSITKKASELGISLRKRSY